MVGIIADEYGMAQSASWQIWARFVYASFKLRIFNLSCYILAKQKLTPRGDASPRGWILLHNKWIIYIILTARHCQLSRQSSFEPSDLSFTHISSYKAPGTRTYWNQTMTMTGSSTNIIVLLLPLICLFNTAMGFAPTIVVDIGQISTFNR